MYGVIGICQTSPVYVKECLTGVCEELHAKVLIVGEKGGVRGHQILLYPSYQLFVNDISRQQQLNGVALVFDTPELLKRVHGIEFFDSSDEYTANTLDIEALKRRITRLLKNRSTVVFTLKDVNALATLIDDQQRGKILHRYTKLLYSQTGPRRDELKGLLLRYLFGDVRKPLFLEQIKPFLRKAQTAAYFRNFWEFLETEGDALLRALREIKRRRFAESINYPLLRSTYGADEYEMQFLSKSYCDTVRAPKNS